MTNFDPAAATAQWLATLSPQETARAVAYTHGSHWLILWSFLVSALVAWIIVRTDLLVATRRRIERSEPRPLLASFAVALVYPALSWALTLPWSIYESWWREKQYGLTSQPFGGWLGEAAIGAAISVVIGAALLVAIYALIRRARRFWWAWASVVTAAFIIVGLIVSPLVIEPIFNTYTPASERAGARRRSGACETDGHAVGQDLHLRRFPNSPTATPPMSRACSARRAWP